MRRPFDVALPSGQVLAGSLEVPATLEGTPAVLLCHGFSGNKSEDGRLFVRLARALAGAGIASLRFDFRGSGDSDGDFEDITVESELEDARAALAALAEVPGVNRWRLAIVGLSLGSVVAALLAGERGDLTALVLWAAIAHPDRVFRGATLPELRPGWAVRPAFLTSVERATPLASLAHHTGPLLCVHGSRDTLPLSEPRAALATSRHPQSRLEVVDGEHTFGADAGKRRAVEITLGWLSSALAAPRSTP